MRRAFSGEKVAVLVASGFAEKDLTHLQKTLSDSGATFRIIGMNQGLVNSWNDGTWGLSFASDQVLNEALAIDFSCLVIPGGQRSINKLKLSAHTQRFINGFINSKKPVVLFEEAVLLSPLFLGGSAGWTVAASSEYRQELEESGVSCSVAPYTICGHVMSGRCDNKYRDDYVEAAQSFLMSELSYVEPQAIAA